MNPHFEIRIFTTQDGYAAIVVKGDKRYVETYRSLRACAEFALNQALDGGVTILIDSEHEDAEI